MVKMLNFSIDKEALKILHRLGNVIYWLCTLIASISLVIGVSGGHIALIFVLVFYGFGWGMRYILSGNTNSIITFFAKYFYNSVLKKRND